MSDITLILRLNSHNISVLIPQGFHTVVPVPVITNQTLQGGGLVHAGPWPSRPPINTRIMLHLNPSSEGQVDPPCAQIFRVLRIRPT